MVIRTRHSTMAGGLDRGTVMGKYTWGLRCHLGTHLNRSSHHQGSIRLMGGLAICHHHRLLVGSTAR